MRNLVEVSDQIKAACISNGAKLLAGFIAATGETNAKVIAAALGIPLRTVQRLKLEVATANANDATGGVSQDANSATDGADENAKCANNATDGASEAPNAPRMASHARVEEKLLPPKQEDTGLVKNPLYPPNVIAVTSWNTAFAQPDERCRLVNGRIVLSPEMRAEWLERFSGDGDGLDLALTQAAAYVQTNASTPLEARVGSQLARIVADRRDRDRRYAAAASQKAASGKNNGKPTVAEIIARRKAAEAVGATA